MAYSTAAIAAIGRARPLIHVKTSSNPPPLYFLFIFSTLRTSFALIITERRTMRPDTSPTSSPFTRQLNSLEFPTAALS